MPMNYPRFNRLAYTPSGAKSKYGELSEKLKSGVSGGGFSPSTFLQGFSGNPYEGVIEVAETIALAVAQSIPEAGFLLSGILSVAFTALNKSMQQDDGFSK